MQVTFKDVGQGDSIIIEWADNDIYKVGIIDCKKKGKLNPVVAHLKDRGYSEIEFIILSHPHIDHYSGFEELLDFIEDYKINVKLFGHTLIRIGSDFWKWFEVTSEDSRLIADIIRKADRLKKELGLIKKFVDVFENWTIPLSKTIQIKGIAPSYDEIELYQKAVDFNFNENKKQASNAANYLSTIISLTKDDSKILLTSDAEKEAFQRILNEGKLNGDYFSLCQAPHHGSYNNYLDTFWSSLNTTLKKNAVFSSGIHKHHKHPHIETVRSFKNNGYDLHSTNIVYGMQEYLEEIRDRSLVLDSISEIDEEYIPGEDKVFNF